jgi:hypothetical protein
MADITLGLVIHHPLTCGERTECEVFTAGLTPERLARFYAKVQRDGNGCWPWAGGRLPRGYGLFNGGRDRDGKQDTRYAHRLMWELANGRRVESGEVVRHACDNPPCCNPAHLLIGTQADNINDAAVQGKYRVAARRRWNTPARERVLESLLHAPRGTAKRVAAEHGVKYKTLLVALCRYRNTVATHG